MCACALYEIAAQQIGELEGLVRQSLTAGDDLVRETAQHAYERLRAGDAGGGVPGERAVAPVGRPDRSAPRRLRGAKVVP